MKYLQENVKKEGIITVNPEENLSVALNKLKSSHDAAFVFDENQKFMGVINPYYAIIKTSANDGSTKVKNALFHPPHVLLEDSIERVVDLMIESKIHYLPVFNKDKNFEGIITARRILRFISGLDVADQSLSAIAHTKKGKVITIGIEEPVSKAITLFKEYKTSKVVAVDKNGKLRGVLSHYDLIPFLVAPTQRQEGRGNGNKQHFHETPIKNFVISAVLKVTDKSTTKKAIQDILEQEIGSIIIVDSDNFPTGIVTTTDLLGLVNKKNGEENLIISNKSMSKVHIPVFEDFTYYLKDFLKNSKDYKTGEVHYKSEKDGHLHKIQLHIKPYKGEVIVFERESHDFSRLLQEIKDAIRNIVANKKK